MPLVRYRLGDYAAWSEDRACPCGNRHPVIERLEGRLDDYLVTSDGRKIGRLSTALKGSPSIHSAQIVQDAPGHAYLLVRPGTGYRRHDADAVGQDIREKIGSFILEVVEVREIPKTARGKTNLVVRLDENPQLKPLYGEIILQEPAARWAVQSSRLLTEAARYPL
jgi:phenylacetate-CoA ligase